LRHDRSVAAHHGGFDFGVVEERRRENEQLEYFPSPRHAVAEMLVHVELNPCELVPDFAQLRRRATAARRSPLGWSWRYLTAR
jgi:hypothetical protein